MAYPIPSFLVERTISATPAAAAGRVRTPVVERGARHALAVLRATFLQEQTSLSGGCLQTVDARVKVLLLICIVIIASVKKTILPEAVIAVFLFGLALSSRLPVGRHYRKIILLTLIFGPVLALPSAFNIMTPGGIVLPVWRFDEAVSVGRFALPMTIGVTDEGLRRIAMLSLRVMNSLSVTLLVLATTPLMELIRALKMLRVHDVFLLTITLTFKYILIFTVTVYDMHLAKMSRFLGRERSRDSRNWAASRIAFLFRKSQQRCDDLVRAMRARGMAGDMKLRPLPPLQARDAAAASGVAAFTLFLLWW